MEHLDSKARACLEALAGRRPRDPDPCDPQCIAHLLALGLVAEVTERALPLSLPRRGLRLTAAGEAVLAGRL